MKVPRIPAMRAKVTPALLCGNTITQNRKILTTGIAPSKLLKVKGPKGTSQ